MRKYLIVLILALILIAEKSYSVDNLEVKTYLDTNNVLIGEPIRLTVETFYTNNLNVIIPTFSDTIGKLEILNVSPPDTIFSENKVRIKNNYSFTSFDAGEYTIPSVVVVFEREGFDSPYTRESQELSVTFATVDIDTSEAIKDIKAPLDAPFSLAEIVNYLLIAALIIAVLLFLIAYLRKRKPKEKVIVKEEPKIPAHIVALQELKELEEAKLWQVDKVKLYYVRLTEILKVYIERRWKFNAPDMTTSEVIEALSERLRDRDLVYELNEMLKIADLAKFAKYRPIAQENEDAMALAIKFVERTAAIHQNPAPSIAEEGKENE